MTFRLPDPVFSNAYLYRQMAEEALASAKGSLAAHRRPKEDGTEGYVITYDPTRTSFKQSLVAVVFARIAIDAYLWLYGSAVLGPRQYKSLENDFCLEDLLPRLGIGDGELHAEAKLFREARNDLVHEKALPMSESLEPLRAGQKEAERAVALMNEILAQLEGKQGFVPPVA